MLNGISFAVACLDIFEHVLEFGFCLIALVVDFIEGDLVFVVGGFVAFVFEVSVSFDHSPAFEHVESGADGHAIRAADQVFR